MRHGGTNLWGEFLLILSNWDYGEGLTQARARQLTSQARMGIYL